MLRSIRLWEASQSRRAASMPPDLRRRRRALRATFAKRRPFEAARALKWNLTLTPACSCCLSLSHNSPTVFLEGLQDHKRSRRAFHAAGVGVGELLRLMTGIQTETCCWTNVVLFFHVFFCLVSAVKIGGRALGEHAVEQGFFMEAPGRENEEPWFCEALPRFD